MTNILSIVTGLPPAIDGVGDYAAILAKALTDRHHIATQFITCNINQLKISAELKFTPLQLPQRNRDILLNLLDRHADLDTLLLHYVGYGYAKRGCPVWLVDALRQWRRAKPTRKLATMFHEVYATARQPWNSQFWTSPLQQKLAKDLIDLSDLVFTSTQMYVDRINKLSNKHQGQIPILPIFSTIGESRASHISFADRQPWLVTFGNSQSRQATYTDSFEQLGAICQQLAITEIYDIGSKSTEIARDLPGVKVNRMGILPAAEISDLLSRARVGFLNYPTTYLAKSTIFAAYTSHRVCPIFDRQNIAPNPDGIMFEQHYWAQQQPTARLDLATAEAIAERAHSWYLEHDVEQTVDRLAKLLTE